MADGSTDRDRAADDRETALAAREAALAEREAALSVREKALAKRMSAAHDILVAADERDAVLARAILTKHAGRFRNYRVEGLHEGQIVWWRKFPTPETPGVTHANKSSTGHTSWPRTIPMGTSSQCVEVPLSTASTPRVTAQRLVTTGSPSPKTPTNSKRMKRSMISRNPHSGVSGDCAA